VCAFNSVTGESRKTSQENFFIVANLITMSVEQKKTRKWSTGRAEFMKYESVIRQKVVQWKQQSFPLWLLSDVDYCSWSNYSFSVCTLSERNA
jgi:hypothetical protein